jgi:hypothetical protein
MENKVRFAPGSRTSCQTSWIFIWGAAPSLKITPNGKTSPVIPPSSKKTTSAGFVAHVQDVDSDTPPLDMHRDVGVAAINLSEDKVKLLCSMFKCVQCCSNEHTFPSCPFMKNWILKKKVKPDANSNSKIQSKTIGGVNSVLASPDSDAVVPSLPSTDLSHIPTIEVESDVENKIKQRSVRPKTTPLIKLMSD